MIRGGCNERSTLSSKDAVEIPSLDNNANALSLQDRISNESEGRAPDKLPLYGAWQLFPHIYILAMS